MELKLVPKKRKFWQPKWEKVDPVLYLLEYTEDGKD